MWAIELIVKSSRDDRCIIGYFISNVGERKAIEFTIRARPPLHSTPLHSTPLHPIPHMRKMQNALYSEEESQPFWVFRPVPVSPCR